MIMGVRNAVIAGMLVTTMGCAPQFVEHAPHPVEMGWAERPVTIENDFLTPSRRDELVYGDMTGRSAVTGVERTRWVKGIDPSSTQIQRPIERSIVQETLGVPGSAGGFLVKSLVFGVNGSVLSAAGELVLASFSDDGKGRYYVEFLHAGPMDEIAISEMTSVWNSLSRELIMRGLDRNEVVMGGSRYNQGMNAIVLVKVGQ